MTLHWPQITILILIVLQIGISLAKDGQPKTGKWSFGWSLFNASILLTLLYFGGFFNQH